MNHPKDHHKCFARLACVKHAASVHPEPGSNSLKKFVQDQIFAWLNFIPFYLLWFCSLRTKFFWTFKDMSLFSYQGSWFVAVHQKLLYHIMFVSICQELFSTFLKSFCSFKLLSSISAAAPCDVDYHITPSTECQHLFLKFFIFFKLFMQFQVRSHILRKHVSTRKKAVRNPHHFPAQFSAQLFFIYWWY